MLVFGAAAGSVLVSYVKARAEGLGYGAKVGHAYQGGALSCPCAVAGLQSAFYRPRNYRDICEYHSHPAYLARPWPSFMLKMKKLEN